MCLVRAEIASVSVLDERFGEFVYLSGEDNETTWPSKITSEIDPGFGTGEGGGGGGGCFV